MLGLLSALIEPLAKILLKAWLGDASAEIGGGLIKYAREVVANGKKAADAVRHARTIATALVTDLAQAMEHERLDEAVIETAAIELAETIADHVDTGLLIGRKLIPDEVADALRRARPIDALFAPSEPEHAAYDLMTRLLAERLCKLAPDLPDYTRERDTVLLSRLADIARDVPAVLARVQDVQRTVTEVRERLDEAASQQQAKRTGYAADYCRSVVGKLDYVEILGLPELGPEHRDARLSVAYLSLTASLAGIGRLGFEELMDILPLFGGRLLVEGPAGSGKSTLLRWTAVQAAAGLPPTTGAMASVVGALSRWLLPGEAASAPTPSNLRIGPLLGATQPAGQPPARLIRHRPLGLDVARLLEQDGGVLTWLNKIIQQATFEAQIRGAWRRAVPFQLRLRHIDGGLPPPDDLPRQLSTALGQPPEGWVREQLASGKVLLLIDGIDEVPEGARREAAVQGIFDYLATYPDCLCIVTSRPGAFERQAFRDNGFIEADINELSEDQRGAFIDTWHRAFAERTAQPVEGAIADLARDLKARLAGQPQIARLATNPLLCAGICALHERSGQTLPKNEWDLCAKLTEMLADQRDRAPGRQGGMRDDAVAHMFEYPVRRGILARLADAMVSQQLSALSWDEALTHVATALARVRDAAKVPPESVLTQLAMRSGVLRIASTQDSDGGAGDAIEFVHNTLRSWLASLHRLDDNKPRELAAQALVTQITEVVVFAAAAPTQAAYAQALVTELLNIAARQTDDNQRRAFEVIALRCDAAAPALNTKLRARLSKLAATLFPPKNFEEAQSLAAMGDLAVPRLRDGSAIAPHAASCARTLRLIATPAALAALETYRASDDMDVLEELAEIFDPLTLPAVLARTSELIQSFRLRQSIKANIRTLEVLRDRTDINALWLDGTTIADIAPISTMIGLRSLSLRSTPVSDLTPIGNLPNLTTLHIEGSEVRDLQPVYNKKNLEELSISGDQLLAFGEIGQLTNLRQLQLSGEQLDLSPISSLTNLESLGIFQTTHKEDSTLDLAPLAGHAALRTLIIVGPYVIINPPFAALRSLRWAMLPACRIGTITSLAELTGLRSLDISQTDVETIAPVLDLPTLANISARESRIPKYEIDRFLAAQPGRTAEWSQVSNSPPTIRPPQPASA